MLNRRNLFKAFGLVAATPVLTKAAEAADLFPEVKEKPKELPFPDVPSVEHTFHNPQIVMSAKRVQRDFEGNGVLDYALEVSWKVSESCAHVEIEIQNRGSSERVRRRDTSASHTFRVKKNGIYIVSVRTADFCGRKSPYAAITV